MAGKNSANTADNSTKITEETISKARKALSEAKPKPAVKITKRDAIIALKTDIQKALNIGYSYKDISELLAGNGLKVSPDSIRAYMRDKSDNDSGKAPEEIKAPEAPVATPIPEPQKAPPAPPVAPVAEPQQRTFVPASPPHRPPALARIAVEEPAGEVSTEIKRKLRDNGFEFLPVEHRLATQALDKAWKGTVELTKLNSFSEWVESWGGTVVHLK